MVEKTYSKGKEHTVYTYDGRGNLVEEEYGKNKKTATVGAYTFDETNRMVLGVNADSESSAYIFNGWWSRPGPSKRTATAITTVLRRLC